MAATKRKNGNDVTEWVAALLHNESSYSASAVSGTPQLFDSITAASEYWIARRSLSSGDHSADPLAGDDG